MATAQRLLFRATLQPQPLLPLTSLACHGSLCWTGSSIQQQTMPTPYFKSSNPIRQCSCSSDTSKVSSSGPTPSSSPAMEEGFDMVYEGFFARPHKRLKYASLLNTFASFAAAPLIISYSSASPIARVAVTTSVIAFAVITTGGLHWFTAPYVHRLLYNNKTDVMRAQTLTLLGGTRWREFKVSSVTQPTGYHPLASFKVQGKTYYIDRANFQNVDLLQRLMPTADEQSYEDDHNT